MSRLLVFLLAVTSGACSSGSYVRVLISDVPAGTANLVVSSAVDGRDAPPQRISAPAAGEQSFAVSVPSIDIGWATIDVTALDDKGCELAGQVASGRPSFEGGVAQLVIVLIPRVGGHCVGDHHPGMVVVVAESYRIGCDLASDPGCSSDATPETAVDVPAFEIDRFEVLLGAYTECVRQGGCPPAVAPATQGVGFSAQTGVTWTAAEAYCRWHGRRLPSEAEWEAAARGTDGRLYPWGDGAPSCELANYYPMGAAGGCRSVDENLLLVGGCPAGASPSGMEDAAGNVLEWVNDHAGRRDALRSNEDRLTGPASGVGRVLKGGGAAFTELSLRVAWRGSLNEDGTGDPTSTPAEILPFIGFRCAR